MMMTPMILPFELALGLGVKYCRNIVHDRRAATFKSQVPSKYCGLVHTALCPIRTFKFLIRERR